MPPAEAPDAQGDRIARCVLEQYRNLPKKGKPASKGSPGSEKQEWTVLAGIVIEDATGRLECVALGTGLKCLNRKQQSPFGDRVNDSHAEIIARRAFLAYLVNSLRDISDPGNLLARDGDSTKCRLREGTRVHMYTSQCPCGDASVATRPTTDHEESVDPPDRGKRRRLDSSSSDESRLAIMPLSDMRGHQDPTATGVLRTKPGRTDAIPTLSMSCSDKIARWNVLGVQGSLLALFIEPIYLATVVVGDGYDHAPIERALNQRVANIDTTSLPAGFRVNQCAVVHSALQFESSRTTVSAGGASTITADASLCWYSGIQSYALVNGANQGSPPARGKCLSERLRADICKLSLFSALARLPTATAFSGTYRQAKQHSTCYQEAKAVLFASPRFKDWAQSPAALEQFDCAGRSPR